MPIEFLEPWEHLLPGQGDRLTSELKRELSPAHPLFHEELVAMARSAATDDVLFGAIDGRLIDVHLTWSGKVELPPFPHHRIYADFSDWVSRVMLPLHDSYNE